VVGGCRYPAWMLPLESPSSLSHLPLREAAFFFCGLFTAMRRFRAELFIIERPGLRPAFQRFGAAGAHLSRSLWINVFDSPFSGFPWASWSSSPLVRRDPPFDVPVLRQLSGDPRRQCFPRTPSTSLPSCFFSCWSVALCCHRDIAPLSPKVFKVARE